MIFAFSTLLIVFLVTSNFQRSYSQDWKIRLYGEHQILEIFYIDNGYNKWLPMCINKIGNAEQNAICKQIDENSVAEKLIQVPCSNSSIYSAEQLSLSNERFFKIGMSYQEFKCLENQTFNDCLNSQINNSYFQIQSQCNIVDRCFTVKCKQTILSNEQNLRHLQQSKVDQNQNQSKNGGGVKNSPSKAYYKAGGGIAGVIAAIVVFYAIYRCQQKKKQEKK